MRSAQTTIVIIFAIICNAHRVTEQLHGGKNPGDGSKAFGKRGRICTDGLPAKGQ